MITVAHAELLTSWRVTHYDPELRAVGNDYGPESWISISDVGEEFAGVVLTMDRYEAVESAHVAAFEAFARESGVTELEIRAGEHGPLPVNGARVSVTQACTILRLLLREEAWCLLESAADDFYVHVGYDYYMYIGSSKPCPEAVSFTADAGLFPEAIPISPYAYDPSDM